METIPFNKPFLCGKEFAYIEDAVVNKLKISGNGEYSQWCQKFFEERFGIHKALLTTSCTDALEMAAILIDIQPGDEVIVPSFTFVSTANAFVLRGARIVFADSCVDFPNIDPVDVARKITKRTRAIVVVHYAGVVCDMHAVQALAEANRLVVIEDAAQAVDSQFDGRYAGSIGDLSAFSFHETKNVIAGEGGLLGINNPKYEARAEIIWEKGTNRSAFSRGELAKYSWIDIGSSFLPSEVTAAFLRAQLERIETIQNRRKEIWNNYYGLLKRLEERGLLALPQIPPLAEQNGHMFFIMMPDPQTRDELKNYMGKRGISAVTHYLPLESSPFAEKHPELIERMMCPNSLHFSQCLMRLPLFFALTQKEIETIVDTIESFYDS